MKSKLVFALCFLSLSVSAVEYCAGKKAGLPMLQCLNDEYYTSKDASLCSLIKNNYYSSHQCKPVGKVTYNENQTIEGLAGLVDFVSFKSFTPASTYFRLVFEEDEKNSPEKVHRVSPGKNIVNLDPATISSYYEGEVKHRYRSFVKTYRCNPKISREEHYQLLPVSKNFNVEYLANKNTSPNTYYVGKFKKNGLGVNDAGKVQRSVFFRELSELKKKYKNATFCADLVYTSWADQRYLMSPDEFNCPALILNDFFGDNQFKINKKILNKDDEANLANQKAIECILNQTDKEVASISTEASASSVNNTGSGLCSKGFIDLAKKRASSAADKIVSELTALGIVVPNDVKKSMKRDKYDPVDPGTMDALGKNRDGTSGPCAYTFTKDDQGKVTETRVEGINHEPYKYVKLTVRFKDKGASQKAVRSWHGGYSIQSPCRELYFECPELNTGKVPSSEFASSDFIDQ